MITVTASSIINAMCQRASNLPVASPLKAVSTENPLRKSATAHTLHGKMPDHVRCSCCSQKLCCVPESRSASVQSVRKTRINMLLPAATLQLFDSLLISSDILCICCSTGPFCAAHCSKPLATYASVAHATTICTCGRTGANKLYRLKILDAI
jgi:hypothetical protein